MTPLARLACGFGPLIACVAAVVPLAATVPAQPPERRQQPPPSAQQPQQKPQVPPVRYETGVDLILVDVTVVDRDGRPVEGLTASDFTVDVNGRPRRIHTVQFVAPIAPEAEAAPAAAPGISTNQESRRGRLFLLVVDETNLSVADIRALDEPLARFFAGLVRGDRVGLITVPAGGPRIDFTTDALRVRRAVTQITGMKASGVPAALSQYNIGLAEALLFQAHSPEWAAVVARVCRNAGDASICKMDVESEARHKVVDASYRTTATLNGLQDAIRNLRDVEGPKTLVFVSGGIVLGRDEGTSISVAQEAAAANTSVYVLHLEQPLVDASVSRPSPTITDDLALGRQGLEMVAGRARGEMFSVPASAAPALARIASETSGYYLLGVEAEPEDRNGKAHQVRVELASSQRGLTLRSRRVFQFNRAAGPGAPDEDRLGALMTTPAAVGEVPLSASVYTLGEPAGGKRQVLIAAEIDKQASEAATVAVGYTIVDASGRERAKAGERLILQPVDPARPSPLRFVRAASLEAGEHTLKLGVIMPDGRRGSIEHLFTMRPAAAGRLQVGDLFVLPAPDGGSLDLRADVLPRVATRRLAIYCEVYGPDPSAFEEADITIEIATTADGPAVMRGKLRAGGTEPTRRIVQAAMSAAALSPGDYVARLVVIDRDGATGQVLRAFRVPERDE